MKFFISKLFILALLVEIIFFAPGTANAKTIRFLCWKGYAAPYVEGFKKQIKQQYNLDIKTEIINVSDPAEFWKKARNKAADIISPAHNLPLNDRKNYAESGVGLEVNLENIPNYKHLLPFLKKNSFVTVGEKVYSVPYCIGQYGLAYNSKKVVRPDSWSVLWEANNKGKYTISRDYSDCNIHITALVLGASYDDLYDVDKLEVKIPKRLFMSKLTTLATNAASFWQSTANPEEFPRLSYAATWGYAVARANKNGGKWKMAMPREGTTSWVDHWLITFAVKNDTIKKRICEKWINYCLSPKVQTGVIRNWGVSPVVTNLTTRHITTREMQTFNVGNNDYWKGLSLWQNQNARTVSIYKRRWAEAIKWCQ